LEQYLKQQADRSGGASLPEEKRKRRRRKAGNTPQFGLHEALFRMTGTDLTRIDGIEVLTATTVISEAGWDMSKWQDENHFVSWLRLCQDNKISGEKIIGKRRLPTHNRLTTAFRIAASTLKESIPIWAHSFGDCGPNSGHQWQSRRWPQNLPVWFIECCAGACRTSIEARSYTKNNIANAKSSTSNVKQQTLASKSLKPLQPERASFWRAQQTGIGTGLGGPAEGSVEYASLRVRLKSASGECACILGDEVLLIVESSRDLG
jgi:hypothetical protein